MQAWPYTPEFHVEAQRLTDYIERERTHDEQAENAAKQLNLQYGSIKYGVFAVMAKQSVLESARREVDFLSSYGEKILSGQARFRRRLDCTTIQKRIAEFEKSWGATESGKRILENLRERLGASESLVRIVKVFEEIYFQTKQAKDWINLIETCSPKALKAAAKEMQVRFTSFQDACLVGHDNLLTQPPEKLKVLTDAFGKIRNYPRPITPEDALENVGLNQLKQWTRALNSAERRLKPDPLLYRLRDLKERNRWKGVSKIERLPDGLRDREARKWEKHHKATPEELERFGTGERARGLYKTRRDNEVALFSKYLEPMADLVLQHTLNRFSDFSNILFPLTDTFHNHAELIKVLDIVLLRKN